MKVFRSLFLVAALMFCPKVHADTTREFVTSCVYGTIAGTLVGVASLAFTSQPGENLRNVARGASLGLYAGILLGFYVTQVVTDGEEAPPVPTEEQPPVPAEGEVPPEASKILPQMNLVFDPSSQKIDGLIFKAALTF
ncbi:MAG: hypothetical protein K2X47_17365 [Bdellovibrionales bacterium]|nr:hypothetical protein [Bdellovibrionales bacterium]